MKLWTKSGKPKNKIMSAAVKLVSLSACIALVFTISGDSLMNAGRSLALVSVGLMRPEGGAYALSERLERTPAAQSNPEAAAADSSKTADTLTPYTPGSGNEMINEPETEEAVTPPEAGDGGKVIEEALSAGKSFTGGVAIKNNTGKTFDIAKFLSQTPDLGIVDTEKPQVLIMHTHTTEAFMSYYAGYYNKSDVARTFDKNMNIMAVGKTISEYLNAKGIGVIHDVTVHDNPKYTGAYQRSEKKIREILNKYPTIKVVLDIHRDAINRSSTVKCKPTVTIADKKAAQLMIITSVNSTKANPHPNWEQNLRLAVRLQSKLHTEYPGLMRPLNLTNSRYNQHLTHGSLLIEVGSEANTINEALYSARLLGSTLADVLNELKK